MYVTYMRILWVLYSCRSCICLYKFFTVTFATAAPVNSGRLVSILVTSVSGTLVIAIGVVLLLVGQRVSQPSSAHSTEPQSE